MFRAMASAFAGFVGSITAPFRSVNQRAMSTANVKFFVSLARVTRGLNVASISASTFEGQLNSAVDGAAANLDRRTHAGSGREQCTRGPLGGDPQAHRVRRPVLRSIARPQRQRYGREAQRAAHARQDNHRHLAEGECVEHSTLVALPRANPGHVSHVTYSLTVKTTVWIECGREPISTDDEPTTREYCPPCAVWFMTTTATAPSSFTKAVVSNMLRLGDARMRRAPGRMNLEKWPI